MAERLAPDYYASYRVLRDAREKQSAMGEDIRCVAGAPASSMGVPGARWREQTPCWYAARKTLGKKHRGSELVDWG